MSVNIDRLLRNAKAEIKAGRAGHMRGELLLALEQFPSNARLLTALAEVQQAVTALPARPFGPHHLQHFLAVRQRFGLNVAIEEMAAAFDPYAPLAAAHSGRGLDGGGAAACRDQTSGAGVKAGPEIP
jgi:hypothetical protein